MKPRTHWPFTWSIQKDTSGNSVSEILTIRERHIGHNIYRVTCVVFDKDKLPELVTYNTTEHV